MWLPPGVYCRRQRDIEWGWGGRVHTDLSPSYIDSLLFPVDTWQPACIFTSQWKHCNQQECTSDFYDWLVTPDLLSSLQFLFLTGTRYHTIMKQPVFLQTQYVKLFLSTPCITFIKYVRTHVITWFAVMLFDVIIWFVVMLFDVPIFSRLIPSTSCDFPCNTYWKTALSLFSEKKMSILITCTFCNHHYHHHCDNHIIPHSIS